MIVNYDSRVIIYERKMFIRLATGLEQINEKLGHILHISNGTTFGTALAWLKVVFTLLRFTQYDSSFD